MNGIDQYIHAATRDNTRRAYQAAVRHFETEWGGFLPATPSSIARYLADHAETLSINTLRQRLAGLAQWHIDQGFPDPTKAPMVKKVLKGMRELHPAMERQAKPLPVEDLHRVDAWISARLSETNSDAERLRLLRDRALVLLGFWRGFRSDEICRLQMEHVNLQPNLGITIYLPRSKGDRQSLGRTCKVPALQRLCPVAACRDWMYACGRDSGYLFTGINRWGHLSESPLHGNSIIPLLRDLFERAGIRDASTYTSHSLRRGFATWAQASGWDTKSLMEYVGWRDVKSALRYIESSVGFETHDASPPAVSVSRARPEPPVSSWTERQVDLKLSIERYHAKYSLHQKARDLIERICLKTHKMRCLDRAKGQYRLTILHESAEHLDSIISGLMSEMQQIADNHHCFIEACFEDMANGKRWN